MPTTESPVPEAEAPRDCPLCPRLVAFREELRAEHPGLVERAGAGVRRSATPGSRIVGLAPGMWGANRTGRPFTGDHAGVLFYATLLKFGLAEGGYGARGRRRAAARTAASSSIRSNACRRRTSRCPRRSRPAGRYYEAALALLPNVRVLVALGQIAHDNRRADRGRQALRLSRSAISPSIACPTAAS